MTSEINPSWEGMIIGDGGPGGLVKEMTEQQAHEHSGSQDIKTDWTESLKLHRGGYCPNLERLEVLELHKSLVNIEKRFTRSIRMVMFAIVVQWVCMIIHEIVKLKYMT